MSCETETSIKEKAKRNSNQRICFRKEGGLGGCLTNWKDIEGIPIVWKNANDDKGYDEKNEGWDKYAKETVYVSSMQA